MDFADKLKQLRKDHGMTQVQLGEKLGLAEITIRQYEIRKRKPSYEALQKISQLFNVELSDLYEDAPPRMPVLEVVQAPQPDPDPQRAELMSNYDALNEAGKDMLVNNSRWLVESGQYNKKSLASS